MSEHTRGPWYAQDTIVLSDSRAITQVFMRGIDNWRANARLIAAAPTTIAWLEWLRDNLITEVMYPADVTIHGLSLDDAIAKAKGHD